MRSHELTIGRTFGVTFDDGDDFFPTLSEFCRANNVQQGYIPFFLAGFSAVKIVGACEKLDDPKAPVWSHVYLTNVEAHGGGTVAFDPHEGKIEPHIHISVGLKEHSATGRTSHLLEAKIQFLTEMVFVEVLAPQMRRIRNAELYNVPILQFGQ